MIRYFDASALVKWFVDEAGSAEVRGWTADGATAIARLGLVEIGAAVARRCREGSLTVAEADRVQAALGEVAKHVIVVELTEAVVRHAVEACRRHPLRSADAVHLASATVLRDQLGRDLPFVVYDARLAACARTEAFETLPV